jgi:excisionase family DNA binding protein
METLLTVPDVIARTKLSRSKVMEMIARQELPSLAIGRARRVREADLDAFIKSLREPLQAA